MFLNQLFTARYQASGFTRESIAAALGCDVEVVGQLDRGVLRPSVGLLIAIREALGCSAFDLFDRSTELDTRPTELGSAIDEWVRATAAAMPPISTDTGQRISATLFPTPVLSTRRGRVGATPTRSASTTTAASTL